MMGSVWGDCVSLGCGRLQNISPIIDPTLSVCLHLWRAWSLHWEMTGESALIDKGTVLKDRYSGWHTSYAPGNTINRIQLWWRFQRIMVFKTVVQSQQTSVSPSGLSLFTDTFTPVLTPGITDPFHLTLFPIPTKHMYFAQWNEMKKMKLAGHSLKRAQLFNKPQHKATNNKVT